jgi:hypothetical protein
MVRRIVDASSVSSVINPAPGAARRDQKNRHAVRLVQKPWPVMRLRQVIPSVRLTQRNLPGTVQVEP